jgi:hypothetical protein
LPQAETVNWKFDRLAPERGALAAAIFALVENAEARAVFGRDRRLFAARFDLAEDDCAALVALDREALRERFQVNPMLLYQLEQRVSS